MESAMGKRGCETMGSSSGGDACAVDRPAAEQQGCTRPSSASEQGGGRWLDVLRISLEQASEGEWYASTMELQLASFDVCVACRGVRTLRVLVVTGMPLSLWGHDSSLVDSFKTPETRRLPALQAAGVVWEMPSAMMVPVLSQSVLLRHVTSMMLTAVVCDSFDNNATPFSRWEDLARTDVRQQQSPRVYFDAMQALLRSKNWSRDIRQITRSISWPPSVRQLSLGCRSNEAVDWVALPRLLERLALGGLFEEPIQSVVWPASLKQLTLGGEFDQPIADVVWPPSLTQLTLGDSFDRSIVHVAWPASLLQLVFGENFDRPVMDVVWPPNLVRLAFDVFDQPITGVTWPATLQQLSFGDDFDQPIADATWPTSLNLLVFGDRFNQQITEVVWPAALQWLGFGEAFRQPLEIVVWPASLKCLQFAECLMEQAATVVWPRSVQVIFSKDKNYDDVNTFGWPPGKDVFDEPDTFVMWNQAGTVGDSSSDSA